MLLLLSHSSIGTKYLEGIQCYSFLYLAPQASQPYIVLAEISFRRGNQEKAKEVSLTESNSSFYS